MATSTEASILSHISRLKRLLICKTMNAANQLRCGKIPEASIKAACCATYLVVCLQ